MGDCSSWGTFMISEKRKLMDKALKCIYLQLPASVADDVNKIVYDVIEELENKVKQESQACEQYIKERDKALDRKYQ